MIIIEKVDGNGTLRLVATNDVASERVGLALDGSDWEDSWIEVEADEDGRYVMLFDKLDQAAILKLINEQPGPIVERVR